MYMDDKCQEEYEPSLVAPIEGIPCQTECDPGEYLAIDTLERTFSCRKCPKNTYSPGGGFSIDGDFGQWTSALSSQSPLLKNSYLRMTCYKYSWFMWLQDECKTCGSGKDGKALECGEATARDTSVAFQTVVRVYFVKKGKVEFLYRKDSTKEKDGWVSGIFSFYVDDTDVLDDNSITDDPNEWKYFSYEVQPGMQELTFIY